MKIAMHVNQYSFGKIFFTFLLFCFSFLNSETITAADSLDYTIKHYTDESGLPQNSVKSIARDKDGFVWMATENGLVRYDGQEFVIFDKRRTQARSSRLFYILPQAGQNNLYALSDSMDVLLIQRSMVKRVPLEQFSELSALPIPELNKIFPASGLPYLYYTHKRSSNYLPVDKGAYYLVTKDSVSLIESGTLSYVRPYNNPDPINFFVYDKGLYQFTAEGRFRKIQKDTVTNVALTGHLLQQHTYKPGHSKLKVYWNPSTDNVFIYFNKGFYKVFAAADGSFTTQLILHDFDFDKNDIVSVLYDENANRIFLGSLSNGLYVFTPKRFQTLLSGQVNIRDAYYAITTHRQSGILTSEGVAFHAKYGATLLPAIKKYSDVITIAADHKGNIWTTQDEWLRQFDSLGQMKRSVRLPCRAVRLHHGVDDNLWVGTASCGLYLFHTQSESTKPLQAIPGFTGVTYILQESSNIVWVAADGGLYKYHVAQKRIDTIAGIQHTSIRALYLSKPGQLWITTNDDGLFLYNNQVLTMLPADGNGYLNYAHCIMEDRNGYLWITTNKGLFKANKIDLIAYANGTNRNVFYNYFSKENGLLTNEFNGGCEPCGLTLNDGSLSLPSMKGLVGFHPSSLREELPDRGIFIDRIELNNAWVDVEDTIRLPNRFNRLQLHVTTPFWGSASILQWEYALVDSGKDTIWYKIPPTNIVTLSALPSGTSVLVIRKSNGYGENNFSYQQLVLLKEPAFYETISFIILLVLLLVLIVAIYTRWRMRKIRKRNKELMAAVAMHTADLKESLQALRLSEEKLKRQAMIQKYLISAIAHDIKSPLKYIFLTAKNAYLSMINGDYRAMESSAKLIYQTSDRVYLLSDNLLEYIKLQALNNQILVESVALHTLVEEKISTFEIVATTQSTIVINQVPDHCIIQSNAKLLGVIIHNLLDNALKATTKGIVKIWVEERADHSELNIDDTGIGMCESVIEWCNQPVSNSKELQERPVPGIGLMMVKDLLTLVNGSMQAKRIEGKGTRVKIILTHSNA